ncbi:tyrosine-type recombinase/integrase [Desulfosporosinus youngiae]|uniref:Site-specific recombinase XerD n=1 Tax=Desulfosporosinus youngiae DSM 17734 TaxID=768710 RepID=H5XVD5_9FIRM|nr:tyrosine-type recombinase/integrase [Desulfosporosinus youngiae]EHQ88934.1 site-specific recombinase XerD [Desulfosporosinus youngiae DSM 17734]EHQ89871.1 site-specific recombinase XerD [Desulfosporosinus youngiae DSM 17734]
MTKEEVLEKLKFDVELRGLSKNTQDEYYTKAKIFQEYFDRPATELGEQDIRKFLHYLTTEKGLASGSVNSYNSGLRFLYGVTLDINLNIKQIPRHRKQRKFPDILTQQEIQTLFKACDNLRDKCILMTIYGAGLRLSEVASLKVSDIHSQKMQLFIRNAKGSKDRYALLSQANLEILRDYWKAYRPKEWLFYSRNKTGTHMTSKAVQNVFHKYINKSKITKNVTVHSLRHSFATHLLESGISIFHIKQLLGHSDISTTCFYLHLLKIESLNVTSPLDLLVELEKPNG